MPLGNVKTWPFGTVGLPRLVLNDLDYRAKGYVWGHDGRVWYCFIDPERYRFEVWKKRLNPKKLALVLINFGAVLVAAIAGQIWMVPYLLLAIPTLPFALLRHYRDSAEKQKAACVTNGPQMQYPFRLTTAGITKAVSLATLGTFVAAGITSYKVGLTIKLSATATYTLSGAVLAGFATVVAALMAANGAAALIFLAGYLSEPFGLVKAAGAVMDPGLNYGGWHHVGRLKSQSLSSYRIAPNQPTALPWGSGGLNPIILAGMPKGPPGGLENVAWGLLPLRPDGSTWMPPPTPGNVEKPPSAGDPPWADPEKWPGGMILVAGCEKWGLGETNAMISHGVVHAVATDGHLSPLLGSSGKLVMETFEALDPIQWYGFMAVPE